MEKHAIENLYDDDDESQSGLSSRFFPYCFWYFENQLAKRRGFFYLKKKKKSNKSHCNFKKTLVICPVHRNSPECAHIKKNTNGHIVSFLFPYAT